MGFLDKLYESNYFGIGLFAVISFLVVTFLIVLFFGKRDEKKRKLEETKELEKTNIENTFKETSTEVPVEVPVINTPIAPINESISLEAKEEVPISPVLNPEVSPINFNDVPITPVAPINYEEEVKTSPIIEPVVEPIAPIINEEETPLVVDTPVEPIKLEPTTYSSEQVRPQIIEPIKITLPDVEEVEPKVIKETPTMVEPVMSYANNIREEKDLTEEIELPKVDFDALAKSISDELDELEDTSHNYHEDVKVSSLDEIVGNKSPNQFSSVYVNEPVSTSNNTMPKIDLPNIKSNEIEPENYKL